MTRRSGHNVRCACGRPFYAPNDQPPNASGRERCVPCLDASLARERGRPEPEWYPRAMTAVAKHRPRRDRGTIPRRYPTRT